MELERFIESFDGTEIYLSVAGTGKPLLLCDGLGCDGFIWRKLRQALGESHQLVHYHHRGHGLSRRPQDPNALTVDDLVGDLLAVLDAAEVDKALLCGHSMGVQLIFEFALRHPERVAGLVPICGSYGTPLDTFHDLPWFSEAFDRLARLSQRFPGQAQWLWSKVLHSRLAFAYSLLVEVNGRVLGHDEMDPYLDHLGSMDVGVFLEVAANINEHTTEERLPEIASPTLVVAGDRDRFTPPWLSRRMHRLIPKAEMLMIPGGTHTAPIEIPELFHLRLERFMQERVWKSKPKRTSRSRAPRKKRSNSTSKTPRPT